MAYTPVKIPHKLIAFLDDLQIYKMRGCITKVDYAKAAGISVAAFEQRIVRARLLGLLEPGEFGSGFRFVLTEKAESFLT